MFTPEEARERIRRYRERALLYLENARRDLKAGQTEKAGEALWGALAQALKALGLRYGRLLRHHREVVEFGLRFGREAGDPLMEQAVRIGEQVHANFYEGFVDLERMKEDARLMEEAVRRLLALAQR